MSIDVGLLALIGAVGVLLAAHPAPEKRSPAGMAAEAPQEVRVLPAQGTPDAVPCMVYPPAALPAGKRAGLVIHLYGRGGSHTEYNLARPSYADLRRLLCARGYYLIVPELGGDHWMNARAERALDAIIAGMTATGAVDPGRVTLVGTSMGAGSGLAYVIRHPDRIRRICALFPMTDFAAWLRESPGFAGSIAGGHGVATADLPPILDRLSALRHPEAFARVPVFLVHGDADTIVPPHHSRDFAALLRKRGSRVTLREAPDIGHDDAAATAFQREIADFLTGRHPSHRAAGR